MGTSSHIPESTRGYFIACQQFRKLLLLSVVLSCTACDALIDCLDADGPVFDRETLAPAVLNQEYQERVRASIKNEPQDDWFNYEFRLTGKLPEGISTFQSGRTFIIEGTSIEVGEFPVELFVNVSGRGNRVVYSHGTSGLCYTSRSRQFVLDVNPL